MDLLNIILNVNKYRKTCFLCFNEKEETLHVHQKLFFCDEYHSADTSLVDIMNYLFPANDILLSQACEDCFNILIKTYKTLRRHNSIKTRLSNIINGLINEVSSINLSSLVTNKLSVRLKVPALNVNTETNCLIECNSDNEVNANEACKKCEMTFSTKESLNEHNSITHKNVNQAVVCEICGKNCKKPHTLRSHLNCHKEKVCPYCSKTLKSHAHYKIHLKNHTEKVVRPSKKLYYNCNMCQYRSLNKNSLQAHINKQHLHTRPFVCEICDKGFYRKSNLTEHMLIHQNVKNLTCELCGDNFVTKKTLKEHLRLHSGEKPYKCEICNKQFVTSGRRSDHFKRKHMEKMITCFLCDKKFSLGKELNLHMKKIHGHSAGSGILFDTNHLYGKHYFDSKDIVPSISETVISSLE